MSERTGEAAITLQGKAVGTDLPLGELEALHERARQARGQAYAPYSSFFVGAAVLASDGTVFAGCNVENGSLGLTQCAERATLAAAVAGGVGPGRARGVRAIAVAGPDGIPCSPCGACRQWISELAPDAVVVFRAPQGLIVVGAADLLPYAFALEPSDGPSVD